MTNTIYIGATINHGEVMANQLFTERPAALIERLKAKYPLIDLLFVNVEEYASAVAELSKAGSVRAKAYAQTKEG